MSSLSLYDDYDQIAGKGEDTTSGLFSPFTFLVIALILTLFGLMMLYSATFDYAVENGYPHYFYLICQLAGLAVGFLIGLAMRLLPFSAVRKSHYLFSAVTAAAFIIYFAKDRGNAGYITAGGIPLLNVPFLAVFSLTLSFPSTLPEIENSDRFGLLYLLAISYHIAVSMLVAYAGGLGAFAVYALVLISMMRPCGFSRSYTVLAALFSAVLFAAMLFAVPGFFRDFAFSIMPVGDDAYYDQSLLSSLSAVMEGGFSGVGIGRGVFKMMRIEGTECRFIFTTMAEELGILGICFILSLVLLYSILAVRTEKRALDEGMKFIAASSIGLSSMIAFPFFFSIMYVLGIFPFAGTSVPFFAFCPGNEAICIAGSYLLYKEIFAAGRRQNVRIK